MQTDKDALWQASKILKTLGTANSNQSFLDVAVFLDKLATVYKEREEKEMQ